MKPKFRCLLGLVALLGIGSAHASSTLTSAQYSRCASVVGAEDGNFAGKRVSLAACNDKVNQAFEFSAGGTIQIGGYCLGVGNGGGKIGDPVNLSACNGSVNQIWKRDVDFIKTANNGLCLAAAASRFPSPIPPYKSTLTFSLTLQSCAFDANRKWAVSGGVSGDWPGAPANKPTSAVAGAFLTQLNVQQVISWIQDETAISNTNFCWKKPGYDRGPAHVPTECDGDKIGAICYSRCPSGYNRLSAIDQTCGGGCDDGFAPTFASGYRTCFRDADVKDSKKSSCPKHWTTFPLTCTGGFPVKTRNRTLSCDSGYNLVAGLCVRPAATRSRPIQEQKILEQSCHSSEIKEAGLCSDRARTGYTCTLTICTQQCAAGSIPCGSGCAKNVGTCTASITDMVVSPAIMVASLATGGAAGVAVKAFKGALVDVKAAAALGATAAELALILKDSIEAYMTAAENDLAAISTQAVEDAVAAKYKKGSANYRLIAREYALMQILASVRDMFQDLTVLAISVADPTGVVGTINAFAKPPCEQHKPIP